MRLAAAELTKPCAIITTAAKELPPDLQGRQFWNGDVNSRADFLQQLLAENDLSDIKNIIVVLGGSEVVMQQLAMPEMPAKELAEAAHWDMLQYVPWADSDYYSAAMPYVSKMNKSVGDVDFYAADFDYGQKQVLAIAAASSSVDNAGAICAAAGLKLQAVTAVLPDYAEADTASTDNFTFSSGAVWGGTFLNSGELEQIETEYGDLIKVLADYATDSKVLNLLPKGKLYKGLLTSPRLQKFTVSTAVCCVAIMMAYGFIIQQMAASELEVAQEKLKALDEVRIKYDQLQSTEQRIAVINKAAEKIKAERIEWHKILGAAGYAATDDARVTDLRQNENKRIELTGKARHIDAATNFSNRLRQTGQFSKVQLTESGASDGMVDYVLVLDAAQGREEADAQHEE